MGRTSNRYEPFTLVLFLDDGCVSKWVLDNAKAAADEVGDCWDYIAPLYEKYHTAVMTAFSIDWWPVVQVHDSYAEIVDEVINPELMTQDYFREALIKIKKTRDYYASGL